MAQRRSEVTASLQPAYEHVPGVIPARALEDGAITIVAQSNKRSTRCMAIEVPMGAQKRC